MTSHVGHLILRVSILHRHGWHVRIARRLHASALGALIFVSLTRIVHLDRPATDHLSIHFLQGLLRLLLNSELDEPVAFGNSRNRVADHLGFEHGGVNRFEGLHQDDIGHRRVKVANVDLVPFWSLVSAKTLNTELVGRSCCSSPVRRPVQLEILVLRPRNHLAV